MAQGLGHALHEEATLDATGALRQTSFESYRIPGALDVPGVEAILHEGAPPSARSASSAGEVPSLKVPASVACAVANTADVPVAEPPLTPTRAPDLLRAGADGPACAGSGEAAPAES